MEKKKNKKTVLETKKEAVVAPAPTEAVKIWDEIKNKNILMFALPDQKVHQYCKPVMVEPNRLYLLTTASAVLPSLEHALGPKYVVELLDKYTVVSRAPVSPFIKK